VANEVNIHFDGVDDFDRAIDELIAKASEGAAKFVAQGGLMIEAAAKARAPVLTGTLRRSIGVHDVREIGLGRWESQTYPNTIYSRRIELGFHGDDSLGRHYDQAGQPYLAPGLESVRGGLDALFTATMAAALEV
jgi:hypothetical protein